MTSTSERVDEVIARRWDIIAERNDLLSRLLYVADSEARDRLAARFHELEVEAEMLLASISTLH